MSTKDEIRDNLQQLISQSLAVPSEDVEQLADALEHYGVNTRNIANRELAIVLNTRKMCCQRRSIICDTIVLRYY